MKTRKILKDVIKEEGKKSITAHVVRRFKNSKEFNYLVDPVNKNSKTF